MNGEDSLRDRFSMAGQVALVVGGRGVLGRRFCAALAEFGADVHSADQPAAVTAGEGRQWDVDVTDSASVQRLVDGVLTAAGQIDALVFSVTAKPADFYKPYSECSLDGWRTVVRAELDGAFLTTQAVGRVMERQRGGSIVLISSIYGVVGNDQRIYENANLDTVYSTGGEDRSTRIYSHAVYPAVKGALISLTRYLAAYWGELGIRVNCVSPGGIAHPAENEEFVRSYSSRVPLRRKGGRNEVSGAVVYLASGASSYTTGHNLIVDGGWTAW